MANAKRSCPEALRCVALAGHRSSGKTSLGEVLLQHTRVTRGIGRVDDGTSLLDHAPEERRHRQTLQLSAAWLPWGDQTIQLIDTPGADVAASERSMGMVGSDAVMVAVDAAGGLQVGTEGALAQATDLELPAIVVLTKIDRVDPSETFEALLHALEDVTEARTVTMQLPYVDNAGALSGLLCVLSGRLFRYADDGSGGFSPEPAPDACAGALKRARERVAEAVALTDDDLLEQYLEHLQLDDTVLRRGLSRAVATGDLLPVFLTSATRGIGAGLLLDGIVDLVPAPTERLSPRGRAWDGTPLRIGTEGEFVGQLLATQVDADGAPWHLVRVWRGVPKLGAEWVHGQTGATCRVRKLYRVRGPRRAVVRAPTPGLIVGVWDAIPGRPGDTLTGGERLEMALPHIDPPLLAWWIRAVEPLRDAEVAAALRQLVTRDRGLELHTDEVSGALLLAAASDVQLSLAVERIQNRYGLRVHHSLPPVGYRETPAGTIEGISGTHVRSGEHGLVSEFGQCELSLGPVASGVEFVDLVRDDEDLPPKYRPAIDAGARAAMRRGPTAGYPVVGVELRLTGGKYDILQSTDDHFRLAGEKATRTALQRAGTRLLEPWWEVEISAPRVVLGELIHDISAHRGRILGMEVEGDIASLRAHCPYRELRMFPVRLRGLSGGRGRLRWRESHYEPLPLNLVQEAIESSPFRGDRGR